MGTQHLDLSGLPEGHHVSSDGEDYWIEHHEHQGKTITVMYDALVKAALQEGFPVISKAYLVRHDGGLDRDGYDVWADRKWIGRFATEAAAHAAVELATGGKHPPEVLAIIPDPATA